MTAATLASPQPAAPARYERITVEPVTPVIGAEIGGVDLRQPLDAETVAEIRAAANAWRVVFFRDQDIDAGQLATFGRNFGPLTPANPIADGMEAHPEVWERDDRHYRSEKVMRKVRRPEAPPTDERSGWHMDTTYAVNPNAYSILHGVVIPEVGGDTVFTNLIMAYERLSAPIRALLDGLRAVHGIHGLSTGGRKDGVAAGNWNALHPLVRVHPETGEKLVFFNPQLISHIHDLSHRESRALIELLFSEVTRPEYVARFRWRPNSIAMWDNRSVAHAGPVNYDFAGSPRYMRRVTVAGDIPVGPDGFRSKTLTGEVFPQFD